MVLHESPPLMSYGIYSWLVPVLKSTRCTQKYVDGCVCLHTHCWVGNSLAFSTKLWFCAPCPCPSLQPGSLYPCSVYYLADRMHWCNPSDLHHLYVLRLWAHADPYPAIWLTYGHCRTIARRQPAWLALFISKGMSPGYLPPPWTLYALLIVG